MAGDPGVRAAMVDRSDAEGGGRAWQIRRFRRTVLSAAEPADRPSGGAPVRSDAGQAAAPAAGLPAEHAVGAWDREGRTGRGERHVGTSSLRAVILAAAVAIGIFGLAKAFPA